MVLLLPNPPVHAAEASPGSWSHKEEALPQPLLWPGMCMLPSRKATSRHQVLCLLHPLRLCQRQISPILLPNTRYLILLLAPASKRRFEQTRAPAASPKVSLSPNRQEASILVTTYRRIQVHPSQHKPTMPQAFPAITRM